MQPPSDSCSPRRFSLPGGLLGLACASLPAQGGQLLWSNPWSNYTTVSSRVWTAPASDLEAADDFELHATIRRVVFDGHGCSSCTPPVVTGATLRFYAWSNGNPGALAQQTFLPTGSPGLLFDPATPATVDFTLPTPFLATGRHFVSLQLHFQGGGYWDIWASSVGSPRLSSVRVRDNLAGTAWTNATVSPVMPQPLYADLTLQLFGLASGATAPPSIPCVTWSELPTQSPAGATHCLLRGVKAFAVDDVWAVGHALVPQGGSYEQLTVAMHWDGAGWTQVPSPSPTTAPAPANCMLLGVDGAASNDLWAAGTYETRVNGGWVGPQVFAMHWDGQGWTVPPGLPLPNTSLGAGIAGSSIQDVKATAGNDVWFVGDWLDIVSASSGQTTRPGFLMHWDGSGLTQTVLPIVTGVAHQYFQSVAASGPHDVWVAGGAGTSRLPGSPVPVLFHFDGSGWTHTPCATPNLPGGNVSLYHVEVLAPNDVWVAGIASTQPPTPPRLFLSHWDGASWSLVPGAPDGGSAVEVVSATEIYSVGSTVWRWDGASWTQTQEFTNLISAGLNAIDALGPCELYAVGGQSRIGQVAPFAARIDAPAYWRTGERLPTQPARAPASLRAITPPLVGSQLRIAIDDPGAALGAGQAATFWVLAAAPAAGYPAPAPFAFGGAHGAPGEVFVDVQAIGYVSPAVAFAAGTGAAVHAVSIPNLANLVGMNVFSQGLLLDASNPANVNFSNGLDLHLGR